jgi:hypothetical protein
MMSENDWKRMEGAIEAAITRGLREAEPDRRRLAAEEAWKAVNEHAKDCPLPTTLRQEMKISILKLILALGGAGTIGGGIGGTVVSTVRGLATPAVHTTQVTPSLPTRYPDSTQTFNQIGPCGPVTLIERNLP